MKSVRWGLTVWMLCLVLLPVLCLAQSGGFALVEYPETTASSQAMIVFSGDKGASYTLHHKYRGVWQETVTVTLTGVEGAFSVELGEGTNSFVLQEAKKPRDASGGIAFTIDYTKATATPKPTAAPTAKPTVTATAKPTATATVKPTATATPKPTATATVKPTATATVKATATATATASAKPTAAATATPTAKPTATAAATSKPTVAATATDTPKPTTTATVVIIPTETARTDESVSGAEEAGDNTLQEAAEPFIEEIGDEAEEATEGSYRTLKLWSEGKDVKALQQGLAALGYKSVKADGVYGQRTMAAVKNFQKKNGLTQDGLVGELTREKLKEYGVEIPPFTEPDNTLPEGFDRSLSMGAEGADVYALQERLIELGYLTGKPDQVFGDKTRAAVSAFQKAEGIKANGVAGPETLRLLFP